MQTQNLVQPFNKAEELFAELCEGELELVCGGGGYTPHPHVPHATAEERAKLGKLAGWTVGGAIAGSAGGPPGALIGALGGFFGEAVDLAIG